MERTQPGPGWLSLALLSLALLAPPCAVAKDKDPEHDPDQIGNRDVGKGVNFYSIEREIALGKEMARETERQAKFIDDSVVAEYVNRLVQNVSRNSDAKVPFTIKVVDSDEVNAFALPGGFMFVNTGLIMRADNEAELAGVLAHEIAHVAARHGTRQATRGQLINYGTIPLIFMGGWAGYGIRQAITLAVPLGFLKFSRNMEAEADLLGLQYMYKSGYDPTEFVNFFERIQTLEKKKPGAVSKLFSSHPMTGDRIRAAQKTIQQDLKPAPQYLVDTSEFHGVRTRLATLGNRLKPRDDPGRPVLRTRPSAKVDETAQADQTGKTDDTDGDRPTLKRN
jgi:beta-barrel assembly-enhancing protease